VTRAAALVAAAALALGAAQAVLAVPPPDGTVVEGVSVPGAAIGDSRAEVFASLGDGSFCQGPTQGLCTYNVSGVGSVSVRFYAPDGSEPNGTPDDLLHDVRYSGYPGWVTTAGVTTVSALADEASVVATYPDATLTYDMFGDLYSVEDRDLGITVYWIRDFYRGTRHVAISTYAGSGGPNPTPTPSPTPVPTPTPSPVPMPTPTPVPSPTPTPGLVVHVADIDVSLSGKTLVARVSVADAGGATVGGAEVTLDWDAPRGRDRTLTATTNGAGVAAFENGAARGTHVVTVTDVNLDGATFDAAGSELSASIDVGH
jgi:hypothetical protein